MIQIKFKNMENSDIARDLVLDRVGALTEKFPGLSEGRIQVTLSMENSPTQPGPDLFKVKLRVARGRYGGITLEKADSNLYAALAEVSDHMLESLNRFGDRIRVIERGMARRLRAAA